VPEDIPFQGFFDSCAERPAIKSEDQPLDPTYDVNGDDRVLNAEGFVLALLAVGHGGRCSGTTRRENRQGKV
jgi:hypothetical protein